MSHRSIKGKSTRIKLTSLFLLEKILQLKNSIQGKQHRQIQNVNAVQIQLEHVVTINNNTGKDLPTFILIIRVQITKIGRHLQPNQNNRVEATQVLGQNLFISLFRAEYFAEDSVRFGLAKNELTIGRYQLGINICWRIPTSGR